MAGGAWITTQFFDPLSRIRKNTAVSVVKAGSVDLATITNRDGTVAANPTAPGTQLVLSPGQAGGIDSDGNFQCWAAFGEYDVWTLDGKFCGSFKVTEGDPAVESLPKVACVYTANVASLTGQPMGDGIIPNINDLVLLVGQTNPAQNGLWKVGAPWVRPPQMPSGSTFAPLAVFVSEGISFEATIWELITTSGIVDTDAQSWTRPLYMDLTTDQVVYGVKTFATSPTVPDPTTGTQAANKESVEATAQTAYKIADLSGFVHTLTDTTTQANNAAALDALLTSVSDGTKILFTAGKVYAISGQHSNPRQIVHLSGGGDWLYNGVGDSMSAGKDPSTVFGGVYKEVAGAVLWFTSTAAGYALGDDGTDHHRMNLSNICIWGSGTVGAYGVQVGTAAHSASHLKWDNVLIANFDIDLYLCDVESSVFIHLYLGATNQGCINDGDNSVLSNVTFIHLQIEGSRVYGINWSNVLNTKLINPCFQGNLGLLMNFRDNASNTGCEVTIDEGYWENHGGLGAIAASAHSAITLNQHWTSSSNDVITLNGGGCVIREPRNQGAMIINNHSNNLFYGSPKAGLIGGTVAMVVMTPNANKFTEGAVNEVQYLYVSMPSGGTFTLTFGGQTTGALSSTASAATIQTALQALSSIGSGNVTVVGGPGTAGAFTVTFTGALAGAAQALITGAGSSGSVWCLESIRGHAAGVPYLDFSYGEVDMTLSENVTAMTNLKTQGASGQRTTLVFRQNATGGWTVNLTGLNIKWANNLLPTISAAPNATTQFLLYFDGNFWIEQARSKRADLLTVRTITGVVNWANTDRIVLLDASGGTCTYQLGTIASFVSDTGASVLLKVRRKDTSGNTASVTCTGGNTFEDGSTSVTLAPGEGVDVFSDGTFYYID